KKAPAKTDRSKGIDLLSEAALLEEAQLKKAIKKGKQETNIHQAGGSSKGANLESEVPDEPKGKLIDTSEGTCLKLGVLNVSKSDSSESEHESWGDSDDDNDQQSDDARIEYDDEDKAANLNKTDDEEEDEFVHTLDDYVPTDDENIDDEEYDRINKEMYDDVNVELKDAELANEERGDEEMTHAEQVNVEHKEVTLRATIKSKVLTVVQGFLGTSLDDALYKVLQRHTAELIKEHSVLVDVVEKLKQQYKP
ncbi:hypothetical protein Tco_1055669, partial [Tanacetum coccineum]